MVNPEGGGPAWAAGMLWAQLGKALKLEPCQLLRGLKGADILTGYSEK